jgi:hypothetical protein
MASLTRRAGLSVLVLWVISKDEPLTREGGRSALQQAVPNLELYASRRSTEILSHDEWFSPDDVFDL